MRKILKYFGFEKLENYVTIFSLVGIKGVKDKKVYVEKGKFLSDFIAMVGIIGLLLVLPITIKINSLLFLFAYIAIVIYYINQVEKNRLKEKKIKIIDKIFKKKIKKDLKIDIKDKKFQKFIVEYYDYLKEVHLTKKEIIKLINNWKKEEAELKKSREIYAKNKIKKEIEEYEDKIKILKKEKV